LIIIIIGFSSVLSTLFFSFGNSFFDFSQAWRFGKPIS